MTTVTKTNELGFQKKLKAIENVVGPDEDAWKLLLSSLPFQYVYVFHLWTESEILVLVKCLDLCSKVLDLNIYGRKHLILSLPSSLIIFLPSDTTSYRSGCRLSLSFSLWKLLALYLFPFPSFLYHIRGAESTSTVPI